MAEEKQQAKNPYLEMFEVWEKMMSERMDILLRNPVFLTSMGKALENSLTFKEHVDKALQAYLQALNLPSTKDVERILDGLGSLRRDMEELRAKVEQLLRKPGGSEPSAVSE